MKIFGGNDPPPSLAFEKNPFLVFLVLYNVLLHCLLLTSQHPVVKFLSGRVRMENVSFRKSQYTDIEVDVDEPNGDDEGSQLIIQYSDFEGSSEEKALESSINGDSDDIRDILYLKENWYGDASGPKSTNNANGNGKILDGDFAISEWSEDRYRDMGSSVLFLPGLKASKLYRENTSGGEDQLWLPNWWGGDIEELFLNANGESIENVYTKDVLKTIPGGKIYQTFLDDLQEMNEHGIIRDYEEFAYDWRMNVEDIVQNGTLYADGEIRYLVDIE